MKPITKDAYELFHQGTLALADVEANGFCVDVDYLDKAIDKIDKKIGRLTERLHNTDIWKQWQKKYGHEAKLGSRKQLGEMLFNELGYKGSLTIGGDDGEEREGGQYATDEDALGKVDHPFVEMYIKRAKLDKAKGTYLLGIRREAVDGRVHCFFNLHTVTTFRGCIAKGTKIEIVRDVSRFPDGVSIENVRAGDYAYCYDDNKNLVIRKVLWAGKTGHQSVIRLHWKAGRGRKGFIDLTPDHRVRMIDGSYVQAKDIFSKADYRSGKESKRSPKIRCLAMARKGEQIYFTGHPEALLDHRFVYEQLKGPLPDHKVVHHKDGNHLNNVPSSLQKLTKSKHSRIHCDQRQGWGGEEGWKKGRKERIRLHQLYGNKWRKGEKTHNWIHLSKFTLLRMIAMAKGRPTYVSMDFETFKRKAILYGIDLRVVGDRYNKKGKYASRGRIKRALALIDAGKPKMKCLGRFGNYSKVRRMFAQRGFEIPDHSDRKIYNHVITKIEWINKKVDVYDLEIEEHHNFIANEICVHNSADRPNLQNQPNRNKMIAEIVRRCFIPRKGHQLLEIDYGALEVRGIASYSKDPVLIKEVLAGDPHSQWAKACYIVEDSEMNKELRFYAKNQFVFPQFYGSYYVDCARNMWETVDKFSLKTATGVPIHEHLRSKGIKGLGACDPKLRPRKGTFEYHIKEVEELFRHQRYKVHTQWREDEWEKYKQRGYIDTLTGFRLSEVYRRNQIINSPIQGSCFHCLLWSLTKLNSWLKRKKFKSRIVCQIHDSIIIDSHPKELQDVIHKMNYFATEAIMKKWDWIKVPLLVEVELCDVDASWYTKKGIQI